MKNIDFSELLHSQGFLLVVSIGSAIALMAGLIALASNKSDSSSDAIMSSEYIERSWGPADAQVVVTEYGDFECEACLGFYQSVEIPLKENYDTKIKFVYKYYPLPIHSKAQIAAEAAEAAGQQGKFWEFHNMLYDRQTRDSDEWNIETLTKYAEELDLDTKKFKKDLEDNKYTSIVRSTKNEAKSKGYTGTPTIEINGKQVTRADYISLTAEIDKLLAEQTAQTEDTTVTQ